MRRAVLRSPFKGTVLVFSLDRLAIIEARYFGRRQDADTGRGIHAGLGVLCRGGRRVIFSPTCAQPRFDPFCVHQKSPIN